MIRGGLLFPGRLRSGGSGGFGPFGMVLFDFHAHLFAETRSNHRGLQVDIALQVGRLRLQFLIQFRGNRMDATYSSARTGPGLIVQLRAGEVLGVNRGRGVEKIIHFDPDPHAFFPFVGKARIEARVSFQQIAPAIVEQLVQILFEPLAGIGHFEKLLAASSRFCGAS